MVRSLTRTLNSEQVCVLVDEYGELCRQLDQHAPLYARAKTIEKQLRAHVEPMPGDAGVTLEGKLWNVQFSACKEERSVTNMQRLYKLLGRVKFITLAKMNLADIDRETTPEQQKTFLERAFTGGRTLSNVLRQPATAAPAIAPQQKKAA